VSSWPIFLAQAAVASPTIFPANADTIPLKDSMAIVISAASFCFAIAAFLRTTFEQRRRLILEQILTEVSALEELSADIVQQVESILCTCSHSELSPQNSFIATQHEFRKAESRAINLEMALPSEHHIIHRNYVNWHRALTGDRFPVLAPEQCYNISDDHLIAISLAESNWRKYLFGLRLRCLRHQVRFWSKS
jgi:hypothetical protein